MIKCQVRLVTNCTLSFDSYAETLSTCWSRPRRAARSEQKDLFLANSSNWLIRWSWRNWSEFVDSLKSRPRQERKAMPSNSRYRRRMNIAFMNWAETELDLIESFDGEVRVACVLSPSVRAYWQSSDGEKRKWKNRKREREMLELPRATFIYLLSFALTKINRFLLQFM